MYPDAQPKNNNHVEENRQHPIQYVREQPEMENQKNVDDARFIKIQHLPATWKEKDNTQYARAEQETATSWKLDDARFIKNQQSRSSLRSCSRSQPHTRSLTNTHVPNALIL